MALSSFVLTNGLWKKISTAGQSGTAWIKKHTGLNSTILIAHTDSAQTYDPDDDPDAGVLDDNIPYADAVDLDIDIAYELPLDRISDELSPDNASDVFYATIRDSGETCTIIADFA
jgi:hypothetical protein